MRNQTYLFTNGAWSQGVDFPQPRKAHATTAFSNSKVLICGGLPGNICWIYDHFLQTFNSIAPLLSGRWGHSLGVIDMKNGTR